MTILSVAVILFVQVVAGCEDDDQGLQKQWNNSMYTCQGYKYYCSSIKKQDVVHRAMLQKFCPMSCGSCVPATTAPPSTTTAAATVTTTSTAPSEKTPDRTVCGDTTCTSGQVCLNSRCTDTCTPGNNFAGCACQIGGSIEPCATGHVCNKATNLCHLQCDWRMRTNCMCAGVVCADGETCEAGIAAWTCARVATKKTAHARTARPGAALQGNERKDAGIPTSVIVGVCVAALGCAALIFFVYQTKKLKPRPHESNSQEASTTGDVEMGTASEETDGSQPAADAAPEEAAPREPQDVFLQVNGLYSSRAFENKLGSSIGSFKSQGAAAPVRTRTRRNHGPSHNAEQRPTRATRQANTAHLTSSALRTNGMPQSESVI